MYSKADTDVALNSRNAIKVEAGINTIYEIVKTSEAEYIIELDEGGIYLLAIAITSPPP